jgi:uncharacterized protein (TIGR02145 family)
MLLVLTLYMCKKDKPLPPVIKTNDITEISYTIAASGGEATDEGSAPILARGICWNNSPNPTITNNLTSEGAGLGSFTSHLTNLTANTLYYVRAYATNNVGTSYGNQVSFSTSTIEVPELTTTQISSVLQTTAWSGGSISDENGGSVTARGICWSTSSNPSTSDYHTNNGSGSGLFTSKMTGLTPSTTYYMRAYAINSAGTAYGNELNFTTIAPITASLTTKNISAITTNAATIEVTFQDDGGSTISSRGVCWNTTGNPTASDSKTSDGVGNEGFMSNLSGLNPNTLYYIKAYAVNSVGTSYGNEMIVRTYAGTVSDAEGNSYYTITIGTQTWMASNLNTTKYRNGDLIPTTAPANLDISAESSPKYQWVYDGNNSNSSIYGRLYTWYAATDTRNVCPAGWHVSTQDDWINLEDYLVSNGYKYEGTSSSTYNNKIAKALAGTSLWQSSQTSGAVGNTDFTLYRNKSGFTALPSGARYLSGQFAGQFAGLGSIAQYFLSNEWDINTGAAKYIDFDKTDLVNIGLPKNQIALSLRCVAD